MVFRLVCVFGGASSRITIVTFLLAVCKPALLKLEQLIFECKFIVNGQKNNCKKGVHGEICLAGAKVP
jgi:hypothetical protein